MRENCVIRSNLLVIPPTPTSTATVGNLRLRYIEAASARGNGMTGQPSSCYLKIGANINAKERRHHDALQVASSRGDEAIVRSLLEKGV